MHVYLRLFACVRARACVCGVVRGPGPWPWPWRTEHLTRGEGMALLPKVAGMFGPDFDFDLFSRKSSRPVYNIILQLFFILTDFL